MSLNEDLEEAAFIQRLELAADNATPDMASAEVAAMLLQCVEEIAVVVDKLSERVQKLEQTSQGHPSASKAHSGPEAPLGGSDPLA